jgi:hypothetical protein
MNSLRVTMYDKSGMLHVNRISRDFAPTSNGMSNSYATNRNAKELEGDEFEMQLDQAMAALKEKPVDYFA